MNTPEPFTLRSQRLGALPIVNSFLTRMGVARNLDTPTCRPTMPGYGWHPRR